MEEADQFPISGMNADRGRQPVRHTRLVGEVCEDGFPLECATFKCWDDADTIERLLRIDAR